MAAVLPVIASSLTEGLPGLTKYLGFALALVAIWLISQGEGHQKQLHLHLADLRLPLLAGVCFGVYFILIHQGSRDATIWPMIAARITGSIVLFFFTMVNHQIHWPDRHVMPLVFLNAVGTLQAIRSISWPGTWGDWMWQPCWVRFIRVRRFYWQGWCCMNG